MRNLHCLMSFATLTADPQACLHLLQTLDAKDERRKPTLPVSHPSLTLAQLSCKSSLVPPAVGLNGAGRQWVETCGAKKNYSNNLPNHKVVHAPPSNGLLQSCGGRGGGTRGRLSEVPSSTSSLPAT